MFLPGSEGGDRTRDHLVTLNLSVSRQRGLYLHPSLSSEDARHFPRHRRGTPVRDSL